MERGGPALVPQWYKVANGSATGNGNLNHHTSSSSHSDEHGIGLSSRNRSSVSDCDGNLSSYRRSSSSNCYASLDKDSSVKSWVNSSFGRSYSERGQEKNPSFCDRQNRSFLGDNGFHDHFDSLIAHRTERDTFRCSHSMVLEKQVDTWPKRSAGNSINDAFYRGSIIGGTGRTSFEKDFPSLGAEVKKGPPDAGRVSFPGLNTVQSHPMGSASILGVDGWTSSLAEVPVVAGAVGPGLSSALQTTPVNQVTAALSTTKGLNMVEALTQGTSQVHTGPQLALHAQRVEELTLRQCKQLTPVMPSMPKTSVFNSSEKPKSKGARGGNFSALPKVGQQPSQLIKHSFLAPARSDIPKTSQSGNLRVLNRERNAVSPTAKEGPSVSKAMSPLGIVPLAAVIPLKSPINSKVKVDNNVTALSPTQSSFGEKRPFYQAQNRNDFFNSIRKKALNCLSAIPETSCVASSSNLEKSGEQIVETANHDSLNRGLNCSIENKKFEDFSACESMGLLPDGEENNLCLEPVVDPEEEAFLQSLGWDKNAGEEALTKEEIDAFVKEYEKRRQSSKLCPWEIKPMMAVLTEPPLSNIAGADGPRLSLFGSERVG